ncbi:unnamed protein product [Lactuca saligna]|uniref:Uncharacterized protein n=1 Tax=Lactuca saligna TaxID=75948 RepID=A0AA36EAS6_LACSI|nr:unnamed protein product [Lactuca saligna]
MGSSNSTIQNYRSSDNFYLNLKTCYGYPMRLRFGANLEFNFGFRMRNGVRPLKNGDDGNRWNFSTMNVVNTTGSDNNTGSGEGKDSTGGKEVKENGGIDEEVGIGIGAGEFESRRAEFKLVQISNPSPLKSDNEIPNIVLLLNVDKEEAERLPPLTVVVLFADGVRNGGE